jgi:hypothetical protein
MEVTEETAGGMAPENEEQNAPSEGSEQETASEKAKETTPALEARLIGEIDDLTSEVADRDRVIKRLQRSQSASIGPVPTGRGNGEPDPDGGEGETPRRVNAGTAQSIAAAFYELHDDLVGNEALVDEAAEELYARGVLGAAETKREAINLVAERARKKIKQQASATERTKRHDGLKQEVEKRVTGTGAKTAATGGEGSDEKGEEPSGKKPARPKDPIVRA